MRHRIAATLVGSLLVTLVGVVTWSTLRIDAERSEARALSRLVLEEVSTGLGSLPGAGDVLEKVVEPSLAFLPEGRPCVAGRRAALGGAVPEQPKASLGRATA